MVPEDTVELISEILAAQFTRINSHYLEMIGQQIKETGTLSPSNLHRLQQMMRMGSNIEVIQQELAEAAATVTPEIAKLLDRVAYEAYQDAAPFYEFKRISQLPFSENVALQRVVKAIEKRTLEEFVNFSQTTVIRDTYYEALDNVITAVQSGLTDYNTAIRRTLRETAKQGLRVEYESGYTRRLDSAVRQNILDGARYINQGVQDETGRQFGSDGVELSAHMFSAPDHEPYQGLQYTNEEFDQLQNSLRRQIGQWNCHHIIFRILMGISVPAHEKEQLDEYKRANAAGITYDDKFYTMYQATQEQRKMETAMRYGQDVIAMAKASGNTILASEMTQTVQAIGAEYNKFSEAANLPTRYDRMNTAMARWANGAQSGIISGTSGIRYPVTAASFAQIPTFNLTRYDGNLLRTQQIDLLQNIAGKPAKTEASAHYSLSGQYLAGGVSLDGQAPAYTISQPYVSIHNHPSGLTFSERDIEQFTFDPNMVIMSAIGNNGGSYVLEQTVDFDAAGLILHFESTSLLHPNRLKSVEQYVTFIEEFLEGVGKYGFTYYR